MQLNIFGKSAEISQINNKDVMEKLKRYLEYNINTNISSNDLANKINIPYSDAKKVMIELFKKDIVDMLFKMYCKNELDITDTETYNTLEDIPSNKCDKCEKECPILNNIIVIYRVLGEDK